MYEEDEEQGDEEEKVDKVPIRLVYLVAVSSLGRSRAVNSRRIG